MKAAIFRDRPVCVERSVSITAFTALCRLAPFVYNKLTNRRTF
ncbi:hypothetical protein PYK22_02672 [Pyrinomonas methylaliphatogenes]|uniref:Uncharacterized protein n=1 Tax=Pyrinomonas methylaliphatogenes TaxID=454194 RepID=A0A0B6X274_9BACT|nr:hypothetical protein PYK22_02672 [Pyrinomonas methylaliphatogenes]